MIVRLLLDEHFSPSLVRRLADLGVYSAAVAHVGLTGQQDPEIWRHALAGDFAVVTMNGRDFLPLIETGMHLGLILFREGALTREEQWLWLEPVVQAVLATGDPDFLLNRVVEVWGPGEFDLRDMPAG